MQYQFISNELNDILKYAKLMLAFFLDSYSEHTV